ncbi:DUF2085 domain-containing protein [Chloroflexota bacterium]
MKNVDGFERSNSIPLKVAIAVIVGLILSIWLLNTPQGLLGKADAIGYAVCHRIEVRSFSIGTRSFPLCARCSGMYLAAVLGLVFQALVGRRRGGTPGWAILTVLGIFFLAFAVDGLNSFLSIIPGFPILYEPQNWSRLLTGTGMGLVIAVALFPAFNQTVWKDRDTRSAIPDIKTLFVLILLALILDWVLLMENPIILYPLALLSAAGVLVLLTMIYSMVWIMILHSENRYSNFNQLIFPLVGGFGIALIQIGLLDLVRFLITGTWDGFHFG